MEGRFARLIILVLAAFAAATSALAGDAEIAKVVGEGMHAFHGGCFEASAKILTDAIDAGSQDPRAFYFRGLAAKRMGDDDHAQVDFMEGARLEAVGDGVFPVGKSLERIQGADRACIERFRRKARLLFAHDAPVAASTVAEPQEEVLRRRRPEMEDLPPPQVEKKADVEISEPEPNEPAEPAEPAETKVAPKTETKDDPFGGDDPQPEPKATMKEPAAEKDPFGDEPAKPKAAESEDAAGGGIDDFK